jgi:hypothetical protein
MSKLLKFFLRNINLVIYKSTPGLLPVFALATLDRKQFIFASLIFTVVSVFSGFMGEALNSLLAKSFTQKSSIRSSYINLTSFVSSIVFFLSIITFIIFYSLDFSLAYIILLILMLTIINIATPSGASLLFNNFKCNKILIFSFLFYIFSFAIFLVISRAYNYFFSVIFFGFVLCVYLQILFLNYLIEPSKLIKKNSLRSDIKSFLNFLPSYLLGGPVHGLCLILFSKFCMNGYQQLAELTSFYPIAMAISFLASIYSPVLIQKLSVSKFTLWPDVRYITIFMLTSGIIVSLIFFFLSVRINAYFDTRLGLHYNLIPYVILIGISMTISLITSAYMISFLNLRYLFLASIVYALVYFAGTIYTIIFDLGIRGVCISQILAFFIMLMIHLYMISSKSFSKT